MFDRPGNAHGDTRQARYPVAIAQPLDLFARGVETGHRGVVDVQTDIPLADDVADLVADRHPEMLVTEVDRPDASGARNGGEDCRPSPAPRAASHRRERALDDPPVSQEARDGVPH